MCMQIVGRLGPEGLDLLRGLLQLDPARRLSARNALAHPFFAALSRETPAGPPAPAERTPQLRHRCAQRGGGARAVHPFFAALSRETPAGPPAPAERTPQLRHRCAACGKPCTPARGLAQAWVELERPSAAAGCSCLGCLLRAPSLQPSAGRPLLGHLPLQRGRPSSGIGAHLVAGLCISRGPSSGVGQARASRCSCRMQLLDLSLGHPFSAACTRETPAGQPAPAERTPQLRHRCALALGPELESLGAAAGHASAICVAQPPCSRQQGDSCWATCPCREALKQGVGVAL